MSAINGVSGKDNTFVHEALKILYKNDAEKLHDRTVAGFTYKNRNPKKKISPAKMNKLREWYHARVKRHGIDIEERTKQSRLNKLVASAISNISRQQSKNKIN